jgi:serine/threonine-protein kinase mTOR
LHFFSCFKVLPNLIGNIRNADVNLREFLFQQLSTLIEIVRQHIISYMDEIFKLIKEFWTPNTTLHLTLINLVEKIAIALGSEFKIYLSQLMPQILRVLHHDTSKDRAVTVKLLQALQMFGNNLDDYLHLIVPPLVKLFDPTDLPHNVSVTALDTVNHLAEILDFSDFSSRIIHPLVRVLDTCPELRPNAMQTLSSLVMQLGKKYCVFVPLVNKTLTKHKITHNEYSKLLMRLQSNTTLALDDEFRLKQARYKNREMAVSFIDAPTVRKFAVSGADLKLVWQPVRRASKEDWLEWLRRLSIGLLKESESPALRSCRNLAQNYPQLLRDLFNAAFVSCWTELSDELKEDLKEVLENALNVSDQTEITQTILNLAEFMEHCDVNVNKLPLAAPLLSKKAMECALYAKALHYKEEEFHKENCKSKIFEDLIIINNKLQQKEAIEGLLEYARSHRQNDEDLKVRVYWYEKLHSWDKALLLYKQELEITPNDSDSIVGQMRCLEALGEWKELSELAHKTFDKIENTDFNSDNQHTAARLAAVSMWGQQDWENMKKYVHVIHENNQDGAFYRAVLAVHFNDFETAQKLIDETRELLDMELTAMAGESYSRAYQKMVCVQMLAELEEVIQYKLIPERQETIKGRVSK